MADIDLDLSLTGGATFEASLEATFGLATLLQGDTSFSGSPSLNTFLASTSLTGESTLAALLGKTIGLDTILQGESNSTSLLTFLLVSNLTGEASLEASSEGALGLDTFLQGASSLSTFLTWKAHPSSSSNPPVVNSASTLQQFINALGPSRASLMVVSSHSNVVDPNPKKSTTR